MNKFVKLLSPIKINLILEIVSKRKDGFHNLRTSFLSLNYGDIISIKQNLKKDIIKTNNPNIPTNEDNTIIKILNLLRKKRKDIPYFKIILKKNIPPGSGLGAGSSNAAIILLYANSFSKDPLAFQNLIEIAIKVGSDIPFFLKGGYAKASGKGDKLTLCKNIWEKYFLLLIPKKISISTKEAFETYDLTKSLKNYKKLIFYINKKKYFNDFEISVFNKHSVLEKYRNILLDNKAELALLSGSGSSVFGYFKNSDNVNKAKNFVGDKFISVICSAFPRWKSWRDLVID